MCDINEINKKIIEILESRFTIDLASLPSGWQYLHFLGNIFHFAARDLLVLLHYVETEFRIIVPKSELLSGRFSTFNNVVEIIRDAISAKEVCALNNTNERR